MEPEATCPVTTSLASMPGSGPDPANNIALLLTGFEDVIFCEPDVVTT
jgi:hypothetical protein